ncbi:MAG: YebB family permuted papain-like enzyme [Moraxellaceae bacterium]|nr:YebB family permuted papain-like enzyme [Moraxellaceae bacterium]
MHTTTQTHRRNAAPRRRLPDDGAAPTLDVADLASQLQVGDLVFTLIDNPLYRRIASASSSWTNHVGIVIRTDGSEPLIAESRVPLSGVTTLSRFLARSAGGRVAVRRLRISLDAADAIAIEAAARKRMGKLYHTGFNLDSSRQFCSKFVREVLLEAIGEEVGEIQSFSTLLAHNPQTALTFWRWWYFGNIPWQRRTVTPSSQLHSPDLHTIFDGHAIGRQRKD